MTDAISSASPATEPPVMVMHQLLLRGMLVGIVAGLLAFGFARAFGEPPTARALAFEAAEAQAKGEAAEPVIVSRETQASIGLLTGVTVYGCALGGLFALAFAFCYGRVGRVSPRACAALLALLGFVAAFAVPFLKYPANPPSIGAPETIGLRTGLYFAMVVLSLVAMMASISLGRSTRRRLGTWNASLAGIVAYGVLIAVAMALLPAVSEVPSDFPATTLWQFRVASLGIQAVLWAVIGLGFGLWTERDLAGRASAA